jgi:hypothetical protein
MKLTPAELAEFARQVAALPPEHSRAAPGQSGSREQPLSYAALLAERRTMLVWPDA